MIRQLTGRVSRQLTNAIVLNVNGVGYLLNVSDSGSKFTLDEEITLHTYLAVRETALDLYGFRLLDELEIFELLISLPKIGPKSAQQILTQADIALLKEAVRNDDPSYLSKMSGIGKKSAEKIVVGLKDKFEAMGYAVSESEPGGEAAGPAGKHQSDTIDALIALGYPPVDARKTVQQLPADINNANDAVKEALKLLNS